MPNPLTNGSATFTFGSTSVVPDPFQAGPTWLAQAQPSPPMPSITQMQFRITGGPIYNIVGFNPTDNSIILDRPYAEPSGTGSYMIYMVYVPALAPDHQIWLSWVDPQNDYRIRRKNLYRTKAEIDRRDPNRSSFSEPIWVAANQYANINGVQYPRFELWPGPQQQLAYNVEYTIRGADIPTTQLLPGIIPDELVILGARVEGYEWVLTNNDKISPARASAIRSAMGQAQAKFNDRLWRVKQNDNDIFDNQVFERDDDPQFSGPLDSDYLQSHDVYLIS